MDSTEKLQMIREQIFAQGEEIGHTFLDSSWTQVLLPCDLRMRGPFFDALSEAARRRGDQMVWIVDRAGQFPEQKPIQLRWNQDAFDEAFSNTLLGHVDVDVFGESGAWGMMVSPESFAVIGGNGDFMETFVELAGGVQALKTAFLDAVESNQVGFHLAGTAALLELLGAVGWA